MLDYCSNSRTVHRSLREACAVPRASVKTLSRHTSPARHDTPRIVRVRTYCSVRATKSAAQHVECDEPVGPQGDLMSSWDKERNRVGKVQEIREKLDALKVEIEHSERGYDLNRAAELKYAVMPKLQVRQPLCSV